MWLRIFIALAGAMFGAMLGVVAMGAMVAGAREDDLTRERTLRLALFRLIRACDLYHDDMLLRDALNQAMEALKA